MYRAGLRPLAGPTDVCDTDPMSAPTEPPPAAIPMTTADSLPPGIQGDRPVSRVSILTSRGHHTPHAAKDGLAHWAQQNDYNAVVGVRLVATPEIVNPGVHTTEVRWAAYGTAISWEQP